MNGIKYRSADEMKDSGIEWLGEIPRDWRQLKVKYIVNHRNVKSTYENDNKYLGLENIESWTGRTIECEEDPIVDGISNVFLNNDVLFSKLRPYLAKCTIASGRGLCSSEFLVMQADLMVPSLLKYTLLTNSVIQTINASTYGAKMPRANWDFIKELSLCLPVSIEQRKIANFLDVKTAQFDSIIAKKEQLIAKLEEAKKFLISEVVTGKVKIVDGQLVPRHPEEMKDSGVEWLGMIPKEWSAKKIKYIKSSKRNSFVDGPFGSNLKSEHYVDDGDVYIVESGFITTGEFLNRDYKTITISHFNTIKRSSCTEGDIVIAKIGANFGMSGILPKLDKPSVVSGNSLKLTVSEQYSNKYIQYSLLALRFQGVIHFIVNGSAQPALTLGSLNELKMCAPPIIEQLEIVEISNHKLGIINNQINKNLYQLALLKSAKQSLISEAVTGKIDLRDWEIIEQGGAS